ELRRRGIERGLEVVDRLLEQVGVLRNRRRGSENPLLHRARDLGDLRQSVGAARAGELMEAGPKRLQRVGLAVAEGGQVLPQVGDVCRRVAQVVATKCHEYGIGLVRPETHLPSQSDLNDTRAAATNALPLPKWPPNLSPLRAPITADLSSTTISTGSPGQSGGSMTSTGMLPSGAPPVETTCSSTPAPWQRRR